MPTFIIFTAVGSQNCLRKYCLNSEIIWGWNLEHSYYLSLLDGWITFSWTYSTSCGIVGTALLHSILPLTTERSTGGVVFGGHF